MSRPVEEAVSKLKAHYTAMLSDLEIEYLAAVQALLGLAIEGHFDFKTTLEILRDDIVMLVKFNLDMQTLRQAHHVMTVEDEIDAWERAPNRPGGIIKPKDSEKAFLTDLNNMIDFAVRNGVGFHFPIEVLGHDVKEVLAHSGNLDLALQNCFNPKATAWARLTPEAFDEAI